MNDQTDQIYKLLDENKPDEAKKVLKEMLSGEMSSEEKGKALVDTTMTYMSIMTDINEKYVALLNERLQELEKATTGIDSAKQSIGLAKTREEVQKS